MKTILIILILALFISLMVNVLIINEANNMARSLEFLSKNKTQMRISTSFRIKAFTNLADNLNKFLDSFHEREKNYILNEKNLQTTIRGLSHDIRTPLTSLDGYLQLLAKTEETHEREKYLSIMQRRILSLKKILDQLFTFVKLQEEEYKLDLEIVDIRKIAIETLFSYYEDFKFKNLEPQINFAENPIHVMSNVEGLERIFQNIYKNILEHGSNPLQMTLKEDDKRVYFQSKNKIKDQVEISKEDIFKEFYKASSSRSGSSTGLGLSITKALVEKLGGTISADIEDGYFIINFSFYKAKKED
jgi:signal transduction histidine kinase